jgi:hypothetical protein
MRRRVTFLAVGVVVAVVLVATVLVVTVSAGRNLDPFRGLGAWVDAFDYVPAFQEGGRPAPVNADTIEDLALLGTETLYLQASIDDPRSKGLLTDRALVGALLERAHEEGVKVVAWYYPQLVDPARDQRRMDALVDFRWRGERFDAVAIDIESRQVPDVTERNARLVELARQTRKRAGELAVGAIVYPAVQMEVVNPNLWPDFPYKPLARHVDVWMPMAYWTYRDPPYRDAFAYTEESVRRLRTNLADEDAVVHPIGGLGALSTTQDYVDFVRAARQVEALGWSVYDADTTFTSAWSVLRGRR